MKYTRLYGKELRKLYQSLIDGFGCNPRDLKKQLKHYTFFLDKDYIYCFSGTATFDDTLLEALPVFQIGNYFGRWIPQGILLSPEGASIIVPIATKQVYELTNEQMKEYLHGGSIRFEPADGALKTQIYLLTYRRREKEADIAIGCAKWYRGEIHNYFGKERRISSL